MQSYLHYLYSNYWFLDPMNLSMSLLRDIHNVVDMSFELYLSACLTGLMVHTKVLN